MGLPFEYRGICSFVIYEIYNLVQTDSIVTLIFVLIDSSVVWLTIGEYKKLKDKNTNKRGV